MSGLRSRRKKVEGEVVSKEKIYCRKCQNMKLPTMFYTSPDKILDSNGLMSICKSCVNDLYVGFYESNHSIQMAVLNTCRLINLKFDQRAIDASVKAIESNEGNPASLMGYYVGKIKIVGRSSVTESGDDMDLTFQNMPSVTITQSEEQAVEYENAKDLKEFWGKNFSNEELAILENKFSEWSKSHSIDTQSERVLLKLICLKEHEIDNAVANDGHVPPGLAKDFQDLLKTSGLNPNNANAAGGGKSLDAFGVWLADIMQFRPEEWVENKSIYRDVDNVEEYGEKFFTSPMRALVTGSREFSLDADDVVEDGDGE